MNENVKNFANTLAIAGITVLVSFSAIFLVITYLSKQKAEEINYALYTGILDKKGSEIESLFNAASLISQNFSLNVNISDQELFHSNSMQVLLNSYIQTDSSFSGLWYYMDMISSDQKDQYNGTYWKNQQGSIVRLSGSDMGAFEVDYDQVRSRDINYEVKYTLNTPDGNPVLRCTYLLKDSDGTAFGLFGVDVSFDQVVSSIKHAEMESGPFIYFVDNQHIVRKHPNDELVGISVDDTVARPELKSMFWFDHNLEYKIYDSQSRQYIFRFNRTLNLGESHHRWCLGMNLPANVARKDFIPIRNFMLLVGFFSFFLIGVFVIYAVFRWKKEKEEREETELLLSSSYAQLLSYIEGSEHVNIYSIDRNYRYLNFNSYHWQEMKRAYGQKPQKRDNILDLLPARISKILKNHYDRALSGEHFMLTIEYENTYYQQIFNPIFDNQNKVIGLTCNFIDITDKVIAQKELEQYREHLEELVDERTVELRRQKEFFQMLIDQVPNQIFVRDRDGVYILANKACAKAFGMTIEDMIGKTIVETHHDKEEAEVFAMEDAAILKDDIVVSFEAHVKNNLGEENWVIVNKTRVSLQDDLFVMGVFVDITYLKTTESRLQEANIELNETISKLKNIQFKLIESEKLASLGQLMGGIAHEINNPINFVAGNVRPLVQDFEDIRTLLAEIKEMGEEMSPVKELIRKYDVDFVIKEIESLLGGIKEGALRIGDIVNNLKTFAKPSSEDFVRADIVEGLISTINLIRYKIRNRITITTHIDELPQIVCIPAKLNQVFLNIVNNAVQSIEDKGEITITAKKISEVRVKIEIIDTGSGISEEIKNKVFDPFFTTKEVGDGTGLGLSLSFSIIKQHFGEISFSPNKPKGTVFTIVLPIKGSPD